jgi:hypothetical protein
MKLHPNAATFYLAMIFSLASCGKPDAPSAPASEQPAVSGQGAASSPSTVQTPAASAAKPMLAMTDPGRDYMKQALPIVMDCNIEAVNDMPPAGPSVRASKSRPLKINGWATDEKAKKLPDALYLALQAASGETYYAVVDQNLKRPDIVRARGSSAYEMAGYSAQLDISSLPKGNYRIASVIVGPSGPSVCHLAFGVEITD